MNQILLDLIAKYGSDFKVSFSISGTAMDQFEAFHPDVIESFKKLADTGNVEFLSETYAHSLAALKAKMNFLDKCICILIKLNAYLVKTSYFQKY